MQSGETSIVIIAPPGPIRAGLETLIASVLPASVIYSLGNSVVPAELRNVQPPALALIDGRMVGAAVGEAIQQLRATWPHLHCLVLAEDRHQLSLAQGAGAVAAILKDGRAADLVQALERRIAEINLEPH